MNKLQEEDKWILFKLNETIKDVTENLNKYEIGFGAQRIYDFVWDEYCDWYIEMVKSRLYGEDKDSKDTAEAVLLYVLKDILKILHPFMPYITEEIWQHLPSNEKALIVTNWPVYKNDMDYLSSVESIEYIKIAIKSIRNARAEMNIIPSRKSKIIFVTREEKVKQYILNGSRYFINLASADAIEVLDNKAGLGEDNISVI